MTSRATPPGLSGERRTTLTSVAVRRGTRACGPAIARLLLEARAAVDPANRQDGATPLYVAAQTGQLELLQALAAAGACIHQPRDDGAVQGLVDPADVGGVLSGDKAVGCNQQGQQGIASLLCR